MIQVSFVENVIAKDANSLYIIPDGYSLEAPIPYQDSSGKHRSLLKGELF